MEISCQSGKGIRFHRISSLRSKSFDSFSFLLCFTFCHFESRSKTEWKIFNKISLHFVSFRNDRRLLFNIQILKNCIYNFFCRFLVLQKILNFETFLFWKDSIFTRKFESLLQNFSFISVSLHHFFSSVFVAESLSVFGLMIFYRKRKRNAARNWLQIAKLRNGYASSRKQLRLPAE